MIGRIVEDAEVRTHTVCREGIDTPAAGIRDGPQAVERVPNAGTVIRGDEPSRPVVEFKSSYGDRKRCVKIARSATDAVLRIEGDRIQIVLLTQPRVAGQILLRRTLQLGVETKAIELCVGTE